MKKAAAIILAVIMALGIGAISVYAAHGGRCDFADTARCAVWKSACRFVDADGEKLAHALDIWFADYTEAVHQITENADMAALLSEDAVLEIMVVGKNDKQCERVLSGMESCTHGQQKVYCHRAHEEELHGAHEHGLSYGKYRAYLELKELGADITPEEVQGMTMCKIRELMDSLSGEQADATESPSGTGEFEEAEETDSSFKDGQDDNRHHSHH